MNITNINKFMAMNKDGEGVLGKLLYFSLGGILVYKEKLAEIGRDFGLDRPTPLRESKTDAFRRATGDIYDRLSLLDTNDRKIVKVYCRDNDRTRKDILSRELIKESLGAETNRYTKLANIYFDKERDSFWYESAGYDYEVDTLKYCDEAERLFELYRTCCGRSQIETIIESMLGVMQATKVQLHGKIYFVPRSHIHHVDVFEDYIEALNRNNLHELPMSVNSLYVADDEKQREKMSNEFYNIAKKEMELYTEKIQYLISSDSRSPSIMERWVLKVEELERKRRNYEDILHRDFEKLNDDFMYLRQLSMELTLRSRSLQKCA